MKEKKLCKLKNNQQHIIVGLRARCTGQFIFYFATRTFQSIQNYLYKLSRKRLYGKRLSGKMIVRETSVTRNDELSVSRRAMHYRGTAEGYSTSAVL